MDKRQRIRTMGNLVQLIESAKSDKSRLVFRKQFEGMKKQLPLATVTA